jgi:hypothetical protein
LSYLANLTPVDPEVQEQTDDESKTLSVFVPTPKKCADDPELTKSQRLGLWATQFEYSNEELQDLLDRTTSIINRSGLPEDEYKKNFGEVAFPNADHVWCGATWNATKLPASAAIMTKYINFQQTPRYNNAWFNANKPDNEQKHGWVYDKVTLSPGMAFDVDTDKPDSLFPKLFGTDVKCYQLFEKYPSLSKPCTVTVNADSLNAHFFYLVQWTDRDLEDIPAALTRYNAIRRQLTALFAADPAYQNDIIRSPFYREGQHRKHPRRKTYLRRKRGDKMPSVEKTTDVSHSAPFAYGILYPIVGYTLDDLEKLGDQLRAILGPEKVALATGQCQDEEVIAVEEPVSSSCGEQRPATTITPPKKHKRKQKTLSVAPRSFPIADQWKLVHTPAHATKNCRNKWLTANLSLRYCRRAEIANKFRANKDWKGFLAYATDRAMELYAQLEDKRDFPVTDVRTIVRSVVGYCMSGKFKAINGKRWSSEEASYVARCRWELYRECVGEDASTCQSASKFVSMSFYQQMISCRHKNRKRIPPPKFSAQLLPSSSYRRPQEGNTFPDICIRTKGDVVTYESTGPPR